MTGQGERGADEGDPRGRPTPAPRATIAPREVDVLVIGAGPAGHKGAIQAAKAGRRVLLVDRDGRAGGECVRRGTIPSKTLRESALALAGLRLRAGEHAPAIGPRTELASLMRRVAAVQGANERFLADQLARNGVELAQGRARFLGPREVEVLRVDGTRERVRAAVVLVATGSRPRRPPGVEVDHEHVLDSDSILSLTYLPRSLCVLGGGVIAAEFATIFQTLGVAVTLVERGDRPLAFLDRELVEVFLRRFEASGGRFRPHAGPVSAAHDGVGAVSVALDDGGRVEAERVLVALGRAAATGSLDLAAAGVAVDARGYVVVDAFGRTTQPGVYAAGDVIGPPALAAAAMEQGRRAIRHALGLPLGASADTLPAGIYTIPEIGSVGLTEDEARAKLGAALVGRARFDEIARGQIAGGTDGLLKLVTDGAGERVLGAQVVGDGAAELVHLAQMAIVGGMSSDVFVEQIFDFPTMAEAYRVAALDVAGQRARLRLAG